MCHVNRWPWTRMQGFCLGQPPHEFSHHILPQTVNLSGNAQRKTVNLPRTLGVLQWSSHGRGGLHLSSIESIYAPVDGEMLFCIFKLDCLRCQAEHWVNFQSQYTDLQLSVNQPPTQSSNSSSTLCSMCFKTAHHNGEEKNKQKNINGGPWRFVF